MQGKAPGRADQGVWGLDLKTSGYVEVDWLILLALRPDGPRRDS